MYGRVDAIESLRQHSLRDQRKFARRLTKLAEVLEESSRDKIEIGKNHVHFDMRTFGEIDPDICGTTACAAGVAGLHPWFREKGFKLRLEKDEFGSGYGFVEYDGCVSSLDSCYKFFGTVWPFNGEYYAEEATPKAVAKMLRGLVKMLKK